MGSVPVLKPTEVCRLLERLGFAVVRQRGSHIQYRHADGRGTTVPMHKGRDIAPPLLRQIARDVGLTVEELISRVDYSEMNQRAPRYWSGTSYVYNPGYAWSVNLDYGYVDFNDKDGNVFYVWPVRTRK